MVFAINVCEREEGVKLFLFLRKSEDVVRNGKFKEKFSNKQFTEKHLYIPFFPLVSLKTLLKRESRLELEKI